MRKIFVNSLFLIALIVPAFVLAQNRHINFEQQSFQQVLKKAKDEHKLVFVDCYTSWCIPCKNMAIHVFTVDSVADFFNTHFVNLQSDMEKGEGPDLRKTYKVEAYPSFLLLNGAGQLVYKFVGGMSAGEFMAKIREGIKPHNRVEEMNKRYASGDRSPAFIREYIQLKINLMEITEGKQIAADYFNSLTDDQRVRPENWFLFGENRYALYLSNVHSLNFDYLADHWAAFVRYNNKAEVEHRLKTLFRRVAEYSLTGGYFKNEQRKELVLRTDEFDHLKNQLKTMDWTDKQEYIDLMDVSAACAEKDTAKVTKLLAANFGLLSAENQKLIYSYMLAYDRVVRNGDFGFKELVQQVCATGKDPKIVAAMEKYRK
ncbi:thioredoxin family protein [Mucilaginibacter sp. RS28]|uniref:Thioredoxin family protein n=1 Tax=Mucilaginibacter straminoryzae TaxID=2932774 RepID=A0A9X1X1Z2_9SPHI|nr:thioredoxin family protein [Mucilaginibacter straminoryzae]MCJ8209757.1 thioredoxin family protein [Mucilaginibacter straminoryzae]